PKQKMLSVVGTLAVLVVGTKIGERGGMLCSPADQNAILITGKNAYSGIQEQL
ncbi:HTH-type transcriptional regulator UlaR, partial [Escherichia coli]|nr:HTH-type transcriptional regulator UlaR [Escherichia coli]